MRRPVIYARLFFFLSPHPVSSIVPLGWGVCTNRIGKPHYQLSLTLKAEREEAVIHDLGESTLAEKYDEK